jgi:hypothetical protein
MILSTQQALIMARDIFAARVTDPRIASEHQTVFADTVSQLNAVIGMLRPDGTIANAAQKVSAYEESKQRVQLLNTIEAVYLTLPPGDLYNAMDLLDVTAESLRDGIGTVEIVL